MSSFHSLPGNHFQIFAVVIGGNQTVKKSNDSYFNFNFWGHIYLRYLFQIPCGSKHCQYTRSGVLISNWSENPIIILVIGLIGGLNRLTMIGITAIPYDILNTLTGLIISLIWLKNRKRFIGIYGVVFLAIIK